jgi:hypothetical protein
MYERFTDAARRVMQLAGREARRFRHEYVGTEHVLLGLAEEGQGATALLLRACGADAAAVRREAEALLAPGPQIVTGLNAPLTARMRKVVDLAIGEARQLGHDHVGAEHLLLGLLREGRGVACQALANLGVKAEAARESILGLLGAPISPGEEEGPEAAAPEAPRRGNPEVKCDMRLLEYCTLDASGACRVRELVGAACEEYVLATADPGRRKVLLCRAPITRLHFGKTPNLLFHADFRADDEGGEALALAAVCSAFRRHWWGFGGGAANAAPPAPEPGALSWRRCPPEEQALAAKATVPEAGAETWRDRPPLL